MAATAQVGCNSRCQTRRWQLSTAWPACAATWRTDVGNGRKTQFATGCELCFSKEMRVWGVHFDVWAWVFPRKCLIWVCLSIVELKITGKTQFATGCELCFSKEMRVWGFHFDVWAWVFPRKCFCGGFSFRWLSSKSLGKHNSQPVANCVFPRNARLGFVFRCLGLGLSKEVFLWWLFFRWLSSKSLRKHNPAINLETLNPQPLNPSTPQPLNPKPYKP